MKCIIAMFDQNGDLEFNLVRFNIEISVLEAFFLNLVVILKEALGVCVGGRGLAEGGSKRARARDKV